MNRNSKIQNTYPSIQPANQSRQITYFSADGVGACVLATPVNNACEENRFHPDRERPQDIIAFAVTDMDNFRWHHI